MLIAKTLTGSNPIQYTKSKGTVKRLSLNFGGERGIRRLRRFTRILTAQRKRFAIFAANSPQETLLIAKTLTGSNPIQYTKSKGTVKRLSLYFGGERGIRTLETLSRLHDFQSCALDQLGDFSMVEIDVNNILLLTAYAVNEVNYTPWA